MSGLNCISSFLHRSPLQVQMSRYISMFRARIRYVSHIILFVVPPGGGLWVGGGGVS